MQEATQQECREEKAREITAKEVLKAVVQENKHLHERIYQLDRRISKFERIFEAAFKLEAEERLGLHKDCKNNIAESAMGPLARLRYRE